MSTQARQQPHENTTQFPLQAILALTCYAGGAILAATGVIASLVTLFLYPAISWFKSDTITIYLLQTIAGFSAVATAHYIGENKKQPTQNAEPRPPERQEQEEETYSGWPIL
jgi:hypothetical protein